MEDEIELPKSWIQVPLGEVCKLKNGYAFKSSEYLQSSGIPVIRISDIGEGKVDLFNCVYVDEKKEYQSYRINKDDILIAMSGATTGKFGIFRENKVVYQNQRVGKFQILDDKVLNNDFLLYLLYSIKGKILKDSYGGAQPNISSSKIEALIIPIPPINEQLRIVAKIEELFCSLDKAIEIMKNVQQQMKVYRQAVLKWAFEGRLTNNNIRSGELPEGWIKLPLSHVAKKVSIKVMPQQKQNSKFIGMDCITPNTLKPFKLYNFSDFKSAGNLFKKNQILYGRMRPYLNKIYKSEFEGVCSGEFIILECEERFNPDLLKYILHQRDFVKFANNKTTGDRPRISYDEIGEYLINVCSLSEQKKIVYEIESRISVCDKIELIITDNLLHAEVLRQCILKKAFKGKITFQNSEDESASIFLNKNPARENAKIGKIKSKDKGRGKNE